MPQQKPQSPTDLRILLDFFKQEVKKEINCCLPGIVQAVNTAAQTVDVKLGIKRVVNVALDGTETIGEYPLLVSCPFVIMSGGTGHLTFEIAANDSCLVLFNDREIENWYLTGTPQAPTTGRLHDKSDAVALIGIRNTQNLISSYFAGTQLLHDSNTHIDFIPNEIDFYANTMRLHGNVEITGSLFIDGETSGPGGTGTLNINTPMVSSQPITAASLNANNGATGTFGTVTVVNGIVISGTP